MHNCSVNHRVVIHFASCVCSWELGVGVGMPFAGLDIFVPSFTSVQPSERESVTSSFTATRSPVGLILRFSAWRFGILEETQPAQTRNHESHLVNLTVSVHFSGPFYLAKVWSVATKQMSEVLGVHERLLNNMGNGRKGSSSDPVWASVCVC